jgi:hypothetical protein
MEVPSRGDWTSGECTSDGVGAEFSGELGGMTKAGCEEEAKSGKGHRENPSEFPRRSNHSTLQSHGEERGGRPLWL